MSARAAGCALGRGVAGRAGCRAPDWCPEELGARATRGARGVQGRARSEEQELWGAGALVPSGAWGRARPWEHEVWVGAHGCRMKAWGRARPEHGERDPRAAETRGGSGGREICGCGRARAPMVGSWVRGGGTAGPPAASSLRDWPRAHPLCPHSHVSKKSWRKEGGTCRLGGSSDAPARRPACLLQAESRPSGGAGDSLGWEPQKRGDRRVTTRRA